MKLCLTSNFDQILMWILSFDVAKWLECGEGHMVELMDTSLTRISNNQSLLIDASFRKTFGIFWNQIYYNKMCLHHL